MFGLTLREKALKVIKERYNYDVGPYNYNIFNDICRVAKENGCNHYDVAVSYTISALSLLSLEAREHRDFVRSVVPKIDYDIVFCRADKNELRQLARELLDAATAAEQRLRPNAYASFDVWLRDFKSAVGRSRPSLAPNKDGMSLVDFMDLTPLRRAHADGVNPTELGEKFGREFNPKDWGLA